MTKPPSATAGRLPRRNIGLLEVSILVALTVWVSHYLLAPYLGYYGDDYAHFTPGIDGTIQSLLHRVDDCLRLPQGRPLHFFATGALSFISANLGGIRAAYVLALLISSCTGVIFYLLLKRTSGSDRLALIGTLAFCLHPALTTHPYLMHAFGLRTSLLCALLALLSYISGRKTLAYVLALASLLNQESCFFLLFAAPLLVPKRSRPLLRELAQNAAILIGIILAVYALRALVGESRTVEFQGHGLGIIKRLLAAPVLGPLTSLFLFVYQPLTTLFHWTAGMTAVFLGSLVALLWVLFRWLGRLPRTERHPEAATASAETRVEFWQSRSRVLLAGGVLLVLSYVTSFTHWPPMAIRGQGTSVHGAGTVGAAIVFACVCCAIIDFARRHGWQRIAIASLAVYFALTVVFGLTIQLDFKQSWENQRWFWSSVIEACPDLTSGTIVFVDNSELPYTYYIPSNTWADAIILAQILEFPADWQQPRVLTVDFAGIGDFVLADTMPWPIESAHQVEWHYPLDPQNVILLERAGDTLQRRAAPLQLGGSTFVSKALQPPADTPWEQGTLYANLIADPARLSPASTPYTPLLPDPDRQARAPLSDLYHSIVGELR